MKDFVIMLVEGVMNAIEEFFASLTAPSTKFTFNAFLYSLGFLALSIVTKLMQVPCFVQWQEATACSVLMFIIVLIDGSVRSDIKSGMSKLKSVASKFSYSGDDGIEEDEVAYIDQTEEPTSNFMVNGVESPIPIYDTTSQTNDTMEVQENGSGQ